MIALGNWFGTRNYTIESIWIGLVMAAAVSLYAIVAYGPEPWTWNWFEITGTWTISVSIWLTRTQNLQSWIWGIVGTILIGIFFFQIDLTGQMILNLGYFLPVSVWAWYNWAEKGEPEDFPPSRLSWNMRMLMLAGMMILAAITMSVITWINPATQYPPFDALVVAASIIAQYLLGLKKVESWWLWLGPVNALSIFLFAMTGAYVLAGLYVVYFIHAAFAIRSWSVKQ
jgi:nicotinamide mononucleotide transporter